jgi:hypothetical protein
MRYRPRLKSDIRHDRTARARLRILKEAHRRGFITNVQAKKVDLNKMVEAGVLVYRGHNQWVPSPTQMNRKRGRPRHLEL